MRTATWVFFLVSSQPWPSTRSVSHTQSLGMFRGLRLKLWLVFLLAGRMNGPDYNSR